MQSMTMPAMATICVQAGFELNQRPPLKLTGEHIMKLIIRTPLQQEHEALHFPHARTEDEVFYPAAALARHHVRPLPSPSADRRVTT